MAEQNITEAKRIVDVLVRTLHEGDSGPSSGNTMVCNEIIKAGSLGHGTAVKGYYDVDLVIYSESINAFKLAGDTGSSDHWLDILQRFLDRKQPGKLSERNRTQISLQFRFDGKIDVDMLVSPLWSCPGELYNFLTKISFEKRQMFSASASKWQVEFFSKQKNEVKELIKRAKAWRNTKWASKHTPGKPKSYLISVLVLRAFERAHGHNFKELARRTTDELKGIVKNHQNADIYWEEYYKVSTYPTLFPRDKPRIVDPANPSNNLYRSGIAHSDKNKKARDYGEGSGDWSTFARFVDTLDLTKTVDEYC